jgi:hypothetical protein
MITAIKRKAGRMQAVLCDICGQPIREEAVEMIHVRGRVMSMEDGRQRIVERDSGGSLRYACLPCGKWIEQAIAHLRVGLQSVGSTRSA